MKTRIISSLPSLRTDQPERLVTDLELAERLSISRRHVHVLRSRGQLRAVRLGNAVRFPLNENLARVLAALSDVRQSGLRP